VTEPNDKLRAAREATASPAIAGEPMSRSELAEAVNAYVWQTSADRQHGLLTATAIARYERGEVRWPTRPYRAALRSVLNASTDAELGFKPTARGRAASLNKPTGTAARRETGRSQSPSRKPLDLDALASGSFELTAAAEATNVGSAGASGLHAELRRIAATYLHPDTNPVPVLMSLTGIRDHVRTLLAGPQPPRVRRDLLLAGGWATALLAWICTDLGRPDLARSHADAAQVCADQADHHILCAWVAKARHSAAYWQGDRDAAAAHAEVGLAHARCAGGGAELMLTSSLALDLARLGRVDEAHAMLAAAQDAAGRYEPSDEDLGGPFTCPPPRAEGYWADTYLELDQPDLALDLADAAVASSEASGDSNPGTERMLRLHQVLSHVRLGQYDGALATLAPVLGTPPELRPAPMLQRLRTINRGLADADGRDAAEVQQAIAELTTQPRLREAIAHAQ
jgi:tetratricopeptide (TPR) repeat protein